MGFIPERKYPRFDFLEIPLIFALQLDAPLKGESPMRVEAKNVSLGGIKFLSNRRISLFQEVKMSFFDKNSGSLVGRAMGKIVRVEEVDTGFGEKTFGLALAFLPGESAILNPYLTSADR